MIDHYIMHFGTSNAVKGSDLIYLTHYSNKTYFRFLANDFFLKCEKVGDLNFHLNLQ